MTDDERKQERLGMLTADLVDSLVGLVEVCGVLSGVANRVKAAADSLTRELRPDTGGDDDGS